LRKIVVIMLLLLCLSADDNYELGKGVRVASLPLYVGGYFSLEYRDRDTQERYRVDDLALLIYGGYEKFSYMAEIEYKNLYVREQIGAEVESSSDTKLHLERLYVDYNYDDSYKLRVGKYNSPIGFWNLLPINVLRETTSNPQSTYNVFPKFTTGLGISHTSYTQGEFKIDLMLQHNEDFDDEYNNYKIDEHYGLNLLYEKEDLALKVNLGYFHTTENLTQRDSLYYFLLSARYESETYQLMAELGHQRLEDEVTTEYAGYMQALYRFTPRHIAIFRAEAYNNKLTNTQDEIAIVAYTYRPLYPIAIKSEYQFHSLELENQFLLSLSVLF